jgi:hypothetical protein
MSNHDLRRIMVTGQISHAERKPASLLDKDFSVLPATMMVEGAYYPYVENLTKPQSLFFSGQELLQSVMSWNGRPVAINHPSGAETCNSPENFNKQWVGYVFNAKYDKPSRSLKADLWIDDDRGAIVNDLVAAGKCLEVSIGAFGDVKPYGGAEPYDYSMSNIVGDHLAILPDTRGACSWEDGCGVRAAVFCHYVASVRDSARTPVYDGVETTSWGSVTKSLEAYVKAYYKTKGMKQPNDIMGDVKELPMAVKKWVASKTLLGEAQSDNSRDLLFFPVVSPDTNKLNEGALKAVVGARGAQADISEKVRKSAQSKAKKLLESKFKSKSNMKSQHNPRGEKEMECVEEKATDQKECRQAKVVTPQVQAAPLREVKAEDNASNEDKFNTEQWLGQAPPDFRNYLVNSMKNYDRTRDSHIGKILNCKEAAFCEKDLRNVSDMSLLESISSLVDCLGNATEVLEQSKNVVPMQHNYQLQAASGKQPEQDPTFAPFKDIDYVKMQQERLETERQRYGRR